MIDVGLMPGDKAVVDRSKIASIGDIVLAVLDGEFTIKTLAKKKDGEIEWVTSVSYTHLSAGTNSLNMTPAFA